ncbi:type II toxin-antitoxin system VapC family toxin [Mesorhizobium xinjiangense]|uniref:type II toxin-antitoxin system VapC family toxin n=1 Tax=Mesorhizobium xinjiangense TaxID=2678685 RepID=UPI0012EE01CB|nr:type II toxin-antitoxin system VapC family toxin [Mesorhizobium xinjiangense]
MGASIWEIAIEVARGKLKTVDNVGQSLLASGFDILPIALDHIEGLHELPDHHRDPFDRMLIAQAFHEGLTVLTSDPAFKKYDITIA